MWGDRRDAWKSLIPGGVCSSCDPTGTKDLAPVRPSGEWTLVTWLQTFGPDGSGSLLGPLLPAFLVLWSCF